MKSNLFLLSLTLSLALFVAAGCGKQSRLDRHLSRADKAFAAGDYDTARIEYLNAFRIDGNHPHAVTQLALIYHDTGSMRQAAPFLGRARELAPDDVEVSDQSLPGGFAAALHRTLASTKSVFTQTGDA
jgi:Tfp pilus assembly protein PilF